MYVGKTRQLSFVLTPSNYHLDSILFASSDTSILTISKAGLMTAKKKGASTISISNLTKTISKSTNVTVLSIPQPPVDTLKPGLIAYYPFNNNANDMSGNGFNGTVHNATITTDRFGNANAAYYFNGSQGADSSWVVIKDNPALRLSNTDFTINAWVKVDAYNGTYGAEIIDKVGHLSVASWILGISGQYGYYKSVSGTGNPYFATAYYTNATVLSGNNSLGTTGWHMITTTYTFASHTGSMYIDGVLIKTTNDFPTSDINNTADIYIGKDNPAEFGEHFFQGKIDDIRIYNIAITPQQITDLYNANN